MMSYHTLPEDGHPVIITHFILSLLALYALISIWAYHHLDIPFDSPDAVTTRFHEWLLAFALAIPLLFPFACYNENEKLTCGHVIFFTFGFSITMLLMAALAFIALPYNLSIKILAVITVITWQLRYYFKFNPWKIYQDQQRPHIIF